MNLPDAAAALLRSVITHDPYGRQVGSQVYGGQLPVRSFPQVASSDDWFASYVNIDCTCDRHPPPRK